MRGEVRAVGMLSSGCREGDASNLRSPNSREAFNRHAAPCTVGVFEQVWRQASDGHVPSLRCDGGGWSVGLRRQHQPSSLRAVPNGRGRFWGRGSRGPPLTGPAVERRHTGPDIPRPAQPPPGASGRGKVRRVWLAGHSLSDQGELAGFRCPKRPPARRSVSVAGHLPRATRGAPETLCPPLGALDPGRLAVSEERV